jgi:hypothetical protein
VTPAQGNNVGVADLPIACSLSPGAIATRRENLLNRLFHRAIDRSDLPNGLRFQFAAEEGILLDIVRTVDAERQCCRFLHFTVTVHPDEGPITLDLAGPPGTREFLDALIGPP